MAHYAESEVFEYMPNGYKSHEINEKKLKGSWTVDGGNIIFENLGVGTSLVYNEKPSIELVFTNDIATAGLAQKQSLLSMVASNAGEQSYNDDCGDPNQEASTN